MTIGEIVEREVPRHSDGLLVRKEAVAAGLAIARALHDEVLGAISRSFCGAPKERGLIYSDVAVDLLVYSPAAHREALLSVIRALDNTEAP